MSPFSTITIYGVGLMGGSLGLALKRAFPKIHVYGLDRKRSHLKLALKRGAIDESVAKPEPAIKKSDLIILATPVQTIISTLKEIGASVRPGTLVTDVGSTKRSVCEAARQSLSPRAYFIGGHPMVGKEESGTRRADANLFLNATYAICPDENVPARMTRAFSACLKAIGAKPLRIGPAVHDEIVAYVSHLPQLMSTALASLLKHEKRRSGTLISLSGGGLRDMIRPSASPFEVWKDICRTNESNIQQALDEFISVLARLHTNLTSRELETIFSDANQFHKKYSTLKKKPIGSSS